MAAGLSTVHWVIPEVHVGAFKEQMLREGKKASYRVQLGARTEIQGTAWGTPPTGQLDTR